MHVNTYLCLHIRYRYATFAICDLWFRHYLQICTVGLLENQQCQWQVHDIPFICYINICVSCVYKSASTWRYTRTFFHHDLTTALCTYFQHYLSHHYICFLYWQAELLKLTCTTAKWQLFCYIISCSYHTKPQSTEFPFP